MNNEDIFSETEDTKLKRFLSGGRIYSQLAVAICCAIVLAVTVAGMIGVYSNVAQAKNLTDLTGIDVSGDLDGQYVKGSAYKFLAKLGYIAESERAATHYYYLMYLDAADGLQHLTLVEAPKESDETLQRMISAYLEFVQSYSESADSAQLTSKLDDMTGRFKKMSKNEEKLMDSGVSELGLSREPRVGYTLKIGVLPKASDTVPYWFIAIPFGAAAVVSTVLFIYGTNLEHKREEANKSPYPYQNRKKK